MALGNAACLFGRKQGSNGKLIDAAAQGIDSLADVEKQNSLLLQQVSRLSAEIDKLKASAGSSGSSVTNGDKTEYYHDMITVKSGAGNSRRFSPRSISLILCDLLTFQAMPFIGDHYPRIDDHLSMDVIGTDPKIESGDFEQANNSAYTLMC
jgi:hypothetical protein